MKLRNKKTGEVKWKDNICLAFGDCNKVYNSLAELNEDWEDAEDKPLIETADARYITKLWASTNLIPSNSNEIEVCQIDSPKGTITQFYSDGLYIQFFGRVAPDTISGRCYTIDELCGKEGK